MELSRPDLGRSGGIIFLLFARVGTKGQREAKVDALSFTNNEPFVGGNTAIRPPYRHIGRIGW